MADLSKDTLLFAREYRRMCNDFENCEDCGLCGHNCDFREINNNEDAERILKCVQWWHDEHTLKTYAQDFREKFPNCTWWDYPRGVCKNRVYRNKGTCDCDGGCKDCWNELMEGDSNETD